VEQAAECADTNLAPELPVSAIRDMCPGISAEVLNDAEHIEIIADSEHKDAHSGSPPAPSTR